MTRLNSSWRNTLVGFSMLVEVAFSEDYCDANATGFGIICFCKWKNKEGRSHWIERNLRCWAPGKAVQKVQKDHLFLFIDVNMRPSTDEGNDPDIWADLVVFEFFPFNEQTMTVDDSCTVTRCGVRVITSVTGDTSLENISPVLFLDPMEVSGNEVEEIWRVSYDGLQEVDKVLFVYIACLFNDEDVGLVAPLIAGIDLDISSGLKVLADRSLIRVSSNGEVVMHCLLRQMGKEILHRGAMLPCRSKQIERLVDHSECSSIITYSQNPENPTWDEPKKDEWNFKMWDWDSRRFEAKEGEERGLDLNLGSGLTAVEDTTTAETSRPNKRLRSGSSGGNYPMCQGDNCTEDLSHAKDYHRRHKVCEVHSKATKALVGKQMQRFCQQCSKFHLLSEFDEGKRSCRRRLAGHNRRIRGTEEYKCDCGTLFWRRASFISHKALCDVLGEESAKNHTQNKELYLETVTTKNPEIEQKSPVVGCSRSSVLPI